MRIYLILVTAVLTFQGIAAQQDPEAKKILDRVSARSRADFPIRVTFDYIYEDLMEQQTTTSSGSLLMDKDKYLLTLNGSVVYCDGTTLWHYLTSANEVYISDAEEGSQDDEFFISNPSDLFTFYQEGFKYRLKAEVVHDGQVYNEIDIYPADLDKNYHTVKLLINKKDDRIFSAEAFGKQAANHTVILKDYQRKVKTDEKVFVFDAGQHPGVEVVDTRF